MSRSPSPPAKQPTFPAPTPPGPRCPICGRPVFWSGMFAAYVCPDMGHWAGPADECRRVENDGECTIRKRGDV